MGRPVDVIPIGERFGRLTILKEVGVHNKARYVQVECTCGRQLHLRWQNIKHGLTRTCSQNGPRC